MLSWHSRYLVHTTYPQHPRKPVLRFTVRQKEDVLFQAELDGPATRAGRKIVGRRAGMSASLTDTMWDSVAAVPELRPDALSKTHCGDWKLLRKLGAGEFAQVQGCQRRGDSTIYACKHIDKSKLVCTSNIKRTLRRVHRVGTEISAMRALRHK